MIKKLKTHRVRQLAKAQNEGIEKGAENTWGAVATVFERYEYNTVSKLDSFNMHTVYQVGGLYFDSREERVAGVLSTENLLLNGYRIIQEGMPLTILIDTTYRLVVEGHGTILVGVMAPDQHFHIVAYAIASQDDADAHEHVLREIKKGVEAVVERYATAGKMV